MQFLANAFCQNSISVDCVWRILRRLFATRLRSRCRHLGHLSMSTKAIRNPSIDRSIHLFIYFILRSFIYMYCSLTQGTIQINQRTKDEPLALWFVPVDSFILLFACRYISSSHSFVIPFKQSLSQLVNQSVNQSASQSICQ